MSRYKKLNKYYEQAGIPEEYWDYLYDEDDYLLYEDFIGVRKKILIEALGVKYIDFGNAISEFESSVIEEFVPEVFNEFQSQFDKKGSERKTPIEYMPNGQIFDSYPIKEMDKIWYASTKFHTYNISG